jgi:hypothetical protein
MREIELEQVLRQALHDEADALPFTVTGDVARTRLAERRSRRGGPRRLMLVAASIAVLGASALGLAAVGGLFEAPEPSPSPPVAELADPDTLPIVVLDVSHTGDPSADPDTTITQQLGFVDATAEMQLDIACLETGAPSTAGLVVVAEGEFSQSEEARIEPGGCDGTYFSSPFWHPSEDEQLSVRATASETLTWRVVISVAPEATETPPTFVEPGELADLTYRCVGHAFPAGLFDEAAGAELAGDSLADAFLDAIASGEVPNRPWRLAGRNEEYATFLGGAPGDLTEAIAQSVETWHVTTVGPCDPQLEIGWARRAAWQLDPAAGALTRSSTEIAVLVNEIDCASGEAPGERLHDPIVFELEDRVVLAFVVDPLEGDQECPGNPSVPVVVELAEPLGDRPILDAGSLPHVTIVDGAAPDDEPEPTAAPVEPGYTLIGDAAGTSAEGPTTVSGDLPAATDTLEVRITCTGTGGLRLVVDERPENLACEAPVVRSFAPRTALVTEVRIEPSGTLEYEVRVLALDVESLPGVGFIPPAATFGGPDGAGVDAYRGCGLRYTPATGTATIQDDCPPSWEPMPDDRVLVVGPDAEMTLELPDGWLITYLVPEVALHAEILPSGRSPEIVTYADIDAFPSPSMGFFAPRTPGDYGIRLTVDGERNGDRFSVPYYVRVRVEG